jgi:NADPH-dependent ferric siderophore reductase
MTYEYTAYVSSGNVNSADEVLRVTAEGEFVWNKNADEMIASGDYSQYPALRHVLKALRENERLRDALKKYGQHRNDCAVTLGGYQCTCGFNQQEQPK